MAMATKEWQWWQWLKVYCVFSHPCFKLAFYFPSTESGFPDLDEMSQVGGKLTYERDFLLQLQTHPMSMLKPEGLPDLEIVLGQARPPSESGFQQK